MNDYAALWMSELWSVCREEPADVRKAKRDADLLNQYRLNALAEHSISPGCAETALPESA